MPRGARRRTIAVFVAVGVLEMEVEAKERTGTRMDAAWLCGGRNEEPGSGVGTWNLAQLRRNCVGRPAQSVPIDAPLTTRNKAAPMPWCSAGQRVTRRPGLFGAQQTNQKQASNCTTSKPIISNAFLVDFPPQLRIDLSFWYHREQALNTNTEYRMARSSLPPFPCLWLRS
jgi:hypothetical protein